MKFDERSGRKHTQNRTQHFITSSKGIATRPLPNPSRSSPEVTATPTPSTRLAHFACLALPLLHLLPPLTRGPHRPMWLLGVVARSFPLLCGTPLCKKASIYFVTGIWVVSSLGYYKLCCDGHSCTRLWVNTFLLGEHQEAGLLGQRAESTARMWG